MGKKKLAAPNDTFRDLAAAVWPCDEFPFARDIHAHPFDDDPRMVFADWLEDRGDPRAEFIRVQCRLAKLRMRDPEYAALEARSQAMEAKYRTRWTGPYPKLPGMLWGIDLRNWSGGTDERDQVRHFFRRGLVSAARCQTFTRFRQLLPALVLELGVQDLQLELSFNQSRELSEMPGFERIGGLLLSKMQAADCCPLLESRRLGPVWRLDLNYSPEARSALKTFLARDESRALRWLSLRQATPAEVEPLLRWKHLGNLDILDVRYGPTGLVDALADSRLRPSYVPLVQSGSSAQLIGWCERLAAAPAMSLAEKMSLSQVQDSPDLVGLKLPPNVVTLDIDGDVAAVGARAFVQSASIEQLQELRLHCLKLNDAGIRALAACGRWRRLKTLYVNSWGLTYANAKALVESLPQVKLLILSGAFDSITKEQKAQLRRAFPGKLVI